MVKAVALTVFTLEDEQIVWTNKSSQRDKSSDVKTGKTNFKTTSSEFVCLIFGSSVKTDKRTRRP